MTTHGTSCVLTTAEAAAELRVNPETVRRWIAAGKLPALRVSPRDYRIERADWDAFVAQLRTTSSLVVGPAS